VISASLLSFGLWTGYVGVAVGALYLLVTLIREWKSGSLW
jgi:hypothetical protein